MSLHRIGTTAMVASLLLIAAALPHAQRESGTRQPRVLEASSVKPEQNTELSSLIAEIRSQADAFVFLSGGASRMREDHQRQLLAMFQSLTLIAKGGRRIVVGDGGTQAGSWKQRGTHAGPAATLFP